jgi:hypothetical protein
MLFLEWLDSYARLPLIRTLKPYYDGRICRYGAGFSTAQTFRS